MASSNSLGLELDVTNISISDSKATQKAKEPIDGSVPDPAGDAAGVEGDGSGGPVPTAENLADERIADTKDQGPKKDKPAPYINPDRVLTGGTKQVSNLFAI